MCVKHLPRPEIPSGTSTKGHEWNINSSWLDRLSLLPGITAQIRFVTPSFRCIWTLRVSPSALCSGSVFFWASSFFGPLALRLIFRWIAKSSSHFFCSRPLVPFNNDKIVQRRRGLHGNTKEHNVFQSIRSAYSSFSACRSVYLWGFDDHIAAEKRRETRRTFYVYTVLQYAVCVCVVIYLLSTSSSCLAYSMLQCLT